MVFLPQRLEGANGSRAGGRAGAARTRNSRGPIARFRPHRGGCIFKRRHPDPPAPGRVRRHLPPAARAGRDPRSAYLESIARSRAGRARPRATSWLEGADGDGAVRQQRRREQFPVGAAGRESRDAGEIPHPRDLDRLERAAAIQYHLDGPFRPPVACPSVIKTPPPVKSAPLIKKRAPLSEVRATSVRENRLETKIAN